MHDGKKRTRLVFADKPLNPRAPLADRSLLPPSPVMQQRVLKVQSRSRLGPPLAAALGSTPAGRSKVPAATLAALGATAALVPLGVLASGVVSVAALGGAVVTGVAGWWSWQRAAAPQAVAGEVAPVDLAAVERLDRLMEAVAPELSEEAFERLLSVKEALAQLVRAIGSEGLGLDDRLYLTECLRRYLPDSISAYLAIPAAQRAEVIEVIDAQRSATAVFLDQLALLQADIGVLEQKLHRSSGDKLLQQQRFLETKKRR